MDASSDSPNPDDRRAPHADDGAIFRNQGGQSGLPAVLPDGRLLRAVLRRRGNREPGARHRPHEARQARGRGHPHVRRAGRARRRLPQPADRARPSRRRLRADGRPGGGEKAGTEVGRQARRRAAGHAGHDHRGTAARARPGASSGRRPEGAFERGKAGVTGSRRSTCRRARSRSARRTKRASRRRLARLEPSEVVASQAVYDEPLFSQIVREMRVPATPLARDGGDGAAAERRVCEFYGVETLDGFGAFTRAEIAAAALALAYVKRTQFEARPALSPPTRRARGASLEIDPATRANLELTRTLSGARDGSLLATIDLTVTPAGARLLAERLASPLTDPEAVNRRLDSLEFPGRGGADARRLAPGAHARARLSAGSFAASASTAAVRAISPPFATASLRRPRWPAFSRPPRNCRPNC